VAWLTQEKNNPPITGYHIEPLTLFVFATQPSDLDYQECPLGPNSDSDASSRTPPGLLSALFGIRSDKLVRPYVECFRMKKPLRNLGLLFADGAWHNAIGFSADVRANPGVKVVVVVL
jgi:hypothetical protein